jgi:hypothetical protein
LLPLSKEYIILESNEQEVRIEEKVLEEKRGKIQQDFSFPTLLIRNNKFV